MFFKYSLIGLGSVGVVVGTGVSVYYGVDRHNKKEQESKTKSEEEKSTNDSDKKQPSDNGDNKGQ